MKGIEKILIFGVFLLVLSLSLTLKICGASPDIVYNPEHDGYCKINYGENFKYSVKGGFCFNKINYSEKEYFTPEEFREVCPVHNFLEWGFSSDCFKKSESI